MNNEYRDNTPEKIAFIQYLYESSPIAYFYKNAKNLHVFISVRKNYDMNQDILIITHNYQAIYFKGYHECTPSIWLMLAHILNLVHG